MASNNLQAEWDEEEEVDIKQLLLVVLTKWRIILIVALIGAFLSSGYYFLKSAPSNATKSYNEEKENYDRMKSLCEEWIKISEETLEKGLPEELPEGRTELEENQIAVQLLIQVSTLKSLEKGLTNPETPKRDFRDIAKYFLGGAVFGGVFGILLLATILIASGRVLSCSELNHRYNLKMLALINQRESNRLLSCGRDGLYMRMKEEEQIRMACSNLQVYGADKEEFVLLGTVNEKKLKWIKELLVKEIDGKSIIYISDFCDKVGSCETLRTHDNVILVEEVVNSRYDEIDGIIKLLSDWNKNIVGSIFLV